VAITALAFTPATSPAGEQSGIYFKADAGGTLAKSTALKEFPDAPPGGSVKFHPGARLSMGGGYRFNDWLSVGGETGFIGNDIKGADATLTQVPMFADVELSLTNRTRLIPFIGGGPGVSISVINIDDDSLGGGSIVDGSTSDAVFAWQAYGGVRFKINDNMSVGLVYKYFGAGSPTWDVERSSQDIRFGNAHVHTFSATFQMSF